MFYCNRFGGSWIPAAISGRHLVWMPSRASVMCQITDVTFVTVPTPNRAKVLRQSRLASVGVGRTNI